MNFRKSFALCACLLAVFQWAELRAQERMHIRKLGTEELSKVSPGKGSAPFQDAVYFVESKGKRLHGSRMVGGVQSEPGKRSFQVALLVAKYAENPRAFFCGGTLIDTNTVVTAAHCVDNGTTEESIAVLVNTQSLKKGGQRVEVAKIFVHEGWNPSTSENDVAVLRLKTRVNAPTVGLMATETSVSVANRKILVVSGWGVVVEGGEISTELKQADIPVVARAVCNDATSYNGAIKPGMICAGRAKGGVDSCQGDSGGPGTFVGTDERPVLAAIVSWGNGCARENFYGVYSSVPYFYAWIVKRQSD
jgi:secreted trypsin-like serine protease